MINDLLAVATAESAARVHIATALGRSYHNYISVAIVYLYTIQYTKQSVFIVVYNVLCVCGHDSISKCQRVFRLIYDYASCRHVVMVVLVY